MCAALHHSSASLDHEQVTRVARVLAALLQEGRGNGFAVLEKLVSSMHHVHCGSDLCHFLLAAIWARDLPLIEAFLRLIKVQIQKADEFCRGEHSVATAAAASDAATTAVSALSMGGACLHTCVQLGYYEGVIMLLNFGVPVDVTRPIVAAGDPLEVSPPYAVTALMTAVTSDLPCDNMLRVAGLLIARGANASFLSKEASIAELSSISRATGSKVKSTSAAISRLVQENSTHGRFKQPFAHITAVISTRDSITKTTTAATKVAVCSCRSGLCQLSRTMGSAKHCPCLTRDTAHRVAVPPFWDHATMSISGIERCVDSIKNETENGIHRQESCKLLPRSSILCSADAMCEGLKPLVAMKTGWTVLEDDQYASGLLSGCRVGVADELAVAAAVAMMLGVAAFIDCAMAAIELGVDIGRSWIQSLKHELCWQQQQQQQQKQKLQQQKQQQHLMALPATFSWMLLQLEENVYKHLNDERLPEHVSVAFA